MVDVIIVGGGLAGLINSILLSRSGLNVILIEKKKYPFHRVCGEYISNETLPFLEKHDLYPTEFEPPSIERLVITSPSGKSFSSILDLGGFGISRFSFDHWLAEKASKSGARLLEETTVTDISFCDDSFTVQTNKGEDLKARFVIGAYGKRAKIDKDLNRPFINDRYPYVGVKYHIRTDAAKDTIALHNFNGGYCGLSQVEDDKYNLCYLTHRDQIKKYGNLKEAENEVLFKNPFLSELFRNSDFLFDKPEVINEISFEKKESVFNHVLMSGDSAGMITPLCGNGMAMAIHSASILSNTIIENWKNGDSNRLFIEKSYQEKWEILFAKRLWVGRKIQSSLFGNLVTSELAILTGKYLKPVARSLIKLTHGKPF